MAKKIDYASMYTLRSDGRYMGYWRDNKGTRHAIYDRDPERLYGKIQDAERPKEKTFGDIAREWQSEHWESIGEGTKGQYKVPFETMIAEHGDFKLEDVTAAEINKMLLREVNQDMSYKHCATLRSMYKQTFDYAIVKGYTLNNPTLAVKVPRGMKRTTREAPEDDVVQTIRKSVNEPFGLFPYFLLYTGFRRGEALAVQWGDIDFDNKLIYCRRSAELHASVPTTKEPKTKAGNRSVPLLDDLAAVLIRPEAAKDTDLIFGDKDGKILTRSAFRSRWTDWCRAVGLYTTEERKEKHKEKNIEFTRTVYHPTLIAHQLRHEYATILFESGVDELATQELMGHADIETTHKIYTHLRQKQRSKAADALNKHFSDLDNADNDNSQSVVNSVVKSHEVAENTAN